jgi:DNA polymerase V
MKYSMYTSLPRGGTIDSIRRAGAYVLSRFPLFAARIPAGFPSPADDYIDQGLDLNELLVRHPAATFFVRVSGESMVGAGIHSGDVLVVDRAEQPRNRSVIIAAVSGELAVKRFVHENGKMYLASENPDYEPLEVTAGMEFEVWGVVVHVIHSFK